MSDLAALEAKTYSKVDWRLIPFLFLAGMASAAGIGLVNSVGNLGGYVGPNVPIWAKNFSANPSAALYVIAAVLLLGAALTFFLIPKNLYVKVGQAARRPGRDRCKGGP